MHGQDTWRPLGFSWNIEWVEIHRSGSGRTGIKTRGQATYRALWFTQLYRNNTGGIPMAMAYTELLLSMNEEMIAMRMRAAEGKCWVVNPVPSCSRPVVLPLVFVPLPWVALNLVRFSARNFFPGCIIYMCYGIMPTMVFPFLSFQSSIKWSVTLQNKCIIL